MADSFWDTLDTGKGGESEFWKTLPDAPNKATASPRAGVGDFLRKAGEVEEGIKEGVLSTTTGALGGLVGKAAELGSNLYYGRLKGDPDWMRKSKEVGEKVSGALTYQPQTPTGKAIMEPVGALGRMMSLPGEAVERGGEALGRAVGLAPGLGYAGKTALEGAMMTGRVIPSTVGKVGAKAITSAIPKGAEARWMGRAMKPSTTLTPEVRAARIETSLREGTPITKGGLEKLNKEVIAKYGQEIDSRIGEYAEAGETGNVKNILDTMNKWKAEELSKKALPKAPAKQIDKVITEFTDRVAGETRLPVDKLQGFKKDLHKELSDFYAALSRSPDKSKAITQQWTNRAKARLAKATGDEIATKFPEIKGLNAREGAALELRKSMTQAVNRISQHNPLSLPGLIALIHSPRYVVVEYLFNNPAFKSKLAIAVRRAREYGAGTSKPAPVIGGLDPTYARARESEMARGVVEEGIGRSAREREYYRTMPIERRESPVPYRAPGTSMVPAGPTRNIPVGEQTSTLPLGFATRERPLQPSIPLGPEGAYTRQGAGPLSGRLPYGAMTGPAVREAQGRGIPGPTLPYEEARGGRYPAPSTSRPPVRSPERYMPPEPTGPKAKGTIKAGESIVEARQDYARFRELSSKPSFLWTAEDKAFHKRYTSGKGKSSKQKQTVTVPYEVWSEIGK